MSGVIAGVVVFGILLALAFGVRRRGGDVHEATLLLSLRRSGWRGKHPGERSTLDSYSTVVLTAPRSTISASPKTENENK